MDRDEILEKSRKENENMDELEKFALMKAGKCAVAAGGILCAAVFAIETFFFDTLRFDLWAVFLTLAGVNLTVKYYYRKKTHELIFGVVELVLAVVFLIINFVRLA
ncbi:MAG: DUF2964 family protein [Eubacterium sp.]|nr:DUF2964 family protein [Eubacterium sp.]